MTSILSDTMQKPGMATMHSRNPVRSATRQNAVIIFARTPQINRSNPDEPYAALPWEDLDSLFTAILGDLIEHTCRAGDLDVLLYRNPLEFSDEFLQPFRSCVRCFEMQESSVMTQVPGAIEHAFTMHYSRVVVLLENHPLIGSALLAGVLGQLSCEDDCIVIGPTPTGSVYLLGVKSNHPALFRDEEPDILSKPERFLRSACKENSLLFPIPSQYPLDSGSHLARVRMEIETMPESDADFPSRTSAMFKSFDKKYKARKSNR